VTLLLERERELAELDAAIEETRTGTGRGLAIEANAGLGKTRLLQEARRISQEAGVTYLSARATELERDFTFALVRQLFVPRLAKLPAEERERALDGAAAAKPALGLGGADKQEQDSFAVLHDLYWLTATLAEREPLLLSIDDAHWADATSLDYLAFLLPRLEELPVLLAVTVRSDEPGQPPGLRRILDDPALKHLSPAPLSEEATTRILTSELERPPSRDFAAICHEVSGGNPFLLSELARSLVERGIEPTSQQGELVKELAPERVARSVVLRLERLSPQAAELARALAILGDGSDLRLICELAHLDLEAGSLAADELRTSAILDAGATLRFIHPLVRNAIYLDVTAAERAQAHDRAAELLRRDGASPEAIATQLLAGEPRGDRIAAENLLEAGERALATGAPRSAIAYLNRAIREPPPGDLRSSVLLGLITASFRAADHAAFAAVESDVRAELEREPALRTEWAIPLTMALGLGGRFDEAASMLGEAVDIALAAGDVERAFQLEAQLSTLALLGPSVPERDLERYADRIDPDGPAGRLAAAMEVRSSIVGGTGSEAVKAAKQALGDDCVIFAEDPELAAPVVAVLALVIADEVDEGRRAAGRALEIARERGATPDLIRAWFLKAFVAWGYGDLVTAEADLRQAIDLARLAGIVPLVLLFIPALIEILVERDELETAETELAAIGMAAGAAPENVIFSTLLLMRAHLRLEQGDFDGCLEDFDAIIAQATKMNLGPGPAVVVSPWAARALVATGRQEQALELAEAATVLARRWGVPSTIAHVTRAAATARGGIEGVALLEEAAGLMDGSPRRLERAHVLADLGEALRKRGRREEAREPLRQAFKLARQCGAARLAKRANVELQATGLAVRRYTPIGVESLTPSERRVAEMAASGMTNRQIAQSLFVTVKTVEAHLSASYDKLDIGSRRELKGALEPGATEAP
jgi:DNA-binding CsgD family transcriptional regulator